MSQSPISGDEPIGSSHEPRGANDELRAKVRESDEKISLLELLIVLAKHKMLVVGLPLVAAIIAVIYSGFLPSISSVR